MTTDTEKALSLLWDEYADACLEHDLPHAQHACDDLHRLVPDQRPCPGASESS